MFTVAPSGNTNPRTLIKDAIRAAAFEGAVYDAICLGAIVDTLFARLIRDDLAASDSEHERKEALDPTCCYRHLQPTLDTSPS